MKFIFSLILAALLTTQLSAQTEQQLVDYFKSHPEADTDGDGKLTRQEARSHRQAQRDPSRGDNLESNSSIEGIDISLSDSPIKEVSLKSDDGVDLSFAYRKPKGKGPFPTILFFHGGGNQSSLEGLKNNLLTGVIQTRFLEKDYVTVQSTRRPFWKREAGEKRIGFYDAVNDASLVVDKVKTLPGVDPDKLVLYGGSGGGILAIVTASQRQVACVVAGEPATVVPMDLKLDIVGGGAGSYRNIMEDPFSAYQGATKQKIQTWMNQIDCPVLVLQGNSEGLFKTNFGILIPEMIRLNKNISSLTFPGKSHGFYWGTTRTGATLQTVDEIMVHVTAFIVSATQ